MDENQLDILLERKKELLTEVRDLTNQIEAVINAEKMDRLMQYVGKYYMEKDSNYYVYLEANQPRLDNFWLDGVTVVHDEKDKYYSIHTSAFTLHSLETDKMIEITKEEYETQFSIVQGIIEDICNQNKK